MGVPYEDQKTFSAQAGIGMKKDVSVAAQMASFRWQHDYLADLVKARMTEPRDDVVSDLAQRVTDGDITVEEAAAMGVGLFVAGHETSANMIALATVALLEHPGQLAILRESDDPEVAATAVEELLRYLGIVHMAQRRIAKEDIEIGGETITAGQGILIELASANRDPRVFPTRTFSTCAGKPRPTMRSVSACTSASASSWRGSNCRWCTARSSGASPP